MKDFTNDEKLHRRLTKIVGQVQAVDRMLNEQVSCEELLSLINAAKSALHKVGLIVLKEHISHCVREGLENGDPNETIEKFAKAVERFSNMC